MRFVVLFAAAAWSLFAVCAQVSGQEPSGPAPAENGAGFGKPANLCQELVTFVRQPEPALQANAQPVQQATAVEAPKSGDAARPVAAGTPQHTSGQSGQIGSTGPGAAGPQGSSQNAAAHSGATANVPSNSLSRPAGSEQSTPQVAQPQAPAAPKPSTEAVQQIEAAAAKNDLLACRAAAQQMRRAGVVMPAPLLALSALDPRLLEKAHRP